MGRIFKIFVYHIKDSNFNDSSFWIIFLQKLLRLRARKNNPKLWVAPLRFFDNIRNSNYFLIASLLLEKCKITKNECFLVRKTVGRRVEKTFFGPKELAFPIAYVYFFTETK